jgi:hypothetical protein
MPFNYWVSNQVIQKALASQTDSLADNHPQTPLPREYEKRFESDKELKTFLDEKELLKQISVCRRTLYNLRASGKIPSIRLGRRNFYHFPSVTAALLRLQRGGNP